MFDWIKKAGKDQRPALDAAAPEGGKPASHSSDAGEKECQGRDIEAIGVDTVAIETNAVALVEAVDQPSFATRLAARLPDRAVIAERINAAIPERAVLARWIEQAIISRWNQIGPQVRRAVGPITAATLGNDLVVRSLAAAIHYRCPTAVAAFISEQAIYDFIVNHRLQILSWVEAATSGQENGDEAANVALPSPEAPAITP